MIWCNDLRLDHNDIAKQLKSITDNINSETIPYNELLKILDTAPSLYSLLNADKWDSTMVNIVARHHQEYMKHAPVELITKDVYKTYLLEGSKRLGKLFKPVPMEHLTDLQTAIFLLRSCRVNNARFYDNKKYKYHVLKMLERGEYAVCYRNLNVLNQVIKKPTNYIGKNPEFDLHIYKLLYSDSTFEKYSYEELYALFSIMPNFVKYFASGLLYIDNSEFMYKYYTESDAARKQEIMDVYMKDSFITDKRSFNDCSWMLLHSQFIRRLIDENIVFEIKLLDGSYGTLKAKYWFFKLMSKAFNLFRGA